MSPNEPVPEDRAAANFFGLMLMAVGGLISVLSGLCSLLVVTAALASVIASAFRPGVGGIWIGILAGIPVVLIFGGIPFAFGAGLFILGRGLRKPRPNRP